MQRRQFITQTGLVLTNGLILSACGDTQGEIDARADTTMTGEWGSVRQQFDLSRDKIHMSALLVSSHPRPVREAIERYRRNLNADPLTYLELENNERKRAARAAVAEYLGSGGADHVALTDSTTMGIAIVYHGLPLQEGDEVLTTDHDYYATHEALRQVAERTGATIRQISLFDEAGEAREQQIVERIREAITPRTRALALTWVHSSTGLKLPMTAISDAVADANRNRDEGDRVLICLDGVHGFGVEDVGVEELGCDFFMAGCHKWLFGPRGTGIVWARPESWARLRPTIPSFIDDPSWDAWASGNEPPGPTTADRMSPGGFKPFEHQWAIAETVAFHQQIGKSRIAERTHKLAGRLKEGLAGMDGVSVATPRDEALSAGIVCFDVAGLSPEAVVNRLRAQDIVATTTPYAEPYPRLTPSIYNSPDEVEAVLGAIRHVA